MSPTSRTEKLENPTAIVSEIGHLLDTVEKHRVNRHKALKHRDTSKGGMWALSTGFLILALIGAIVNHPP